MEKEIIIASKNKGKIKQVAGILKEFKVISLIDLGEEIDVEEDGKTFEENAVKKAVEISKMLENRMCMADDSGLEIEWLDGFPGVFTKRWFDGTDRERNLEILKKLEGVKREDRRASFIASIAVAKGDRYFVSTERLKGYIADCCRGENGFGFDEIFELQDGRTLAEISDEEKMVIGVRRKALEKVLMKLEEDCFEQDM